MNTDLRSRAANRNDTLASAKGDPYKAAAQPDLSIESTTLRNAELVEAHVRAAE